MTVKERGTIVGGMTSKHINATEKFDLDLLATQIEELIALCEQLQRENDELCARQAQMEARQTRLHENNEFSRRQIETMISRLKVLETEL